jgi:hypothetical protein
VKRRDFVIRLAVLGAVPGVLSQACSGGGDGGGGGGLDCTDVSGLAPADVQMRTSQQYVEASTHGAQTCATCNFYQAPAQAGGCGTCQVIRGPINPAGYCNLFVARPS